MQKRYLVGMMKSLVALLAVASFMGTGTAWGAARDYPAKPVTLIVPFAAGGGTDIGTRIATKAAEKFLGRPFVIQNVDGGGSEVGVSQMVRSRPDGYTLAGFNSASVILTTMRKASYHPVSDVAPICRLEIYPDWPLRVFSRNPARHRPTFE